MWEKEKILVTSISSFPTMFSTLWKTIYVFWSTFLFVSAFMNMNKSWILSWADWWNYAFYQFVKWQKFKAFCTQQPIWLHEDCFDYQHFLSFPTLFSKGFFLRNFKSQDCMVKGQMVRNVVGKVKNTLSTFCVSHNDFKTSLLKTLWEKEKLLIMSNFSFSHSVFSPFG